MTKSSYAGYQKFVAGRKLMEIDYYGGPHARRDNVERVLVQQALQLGGVDVEPNWLFVQGYNHALQLVMTGRAVISASPVWLDDVFTVRDDLFISPAFVEYGEFVVGLYTSPDNQKALNSTSLNDLKQLTAVSTRQWFTDWKTLKAFNFKVRDMHPWPAMVKAVAKQRADFTLAPFTSLPNMELNRSGMTLIPIPNFRIALEGSRHYIVSRDHPDGEKVIAALRKGISVLREQDRIRRAYKECGFFHQAVDKWQLLTINPYSRRDLH